VIICNIRNYSVEDMVSHPREQCGIVSMKTVIPLVTAVRASSHNVVIRFPANFTGGDMIREPTSEDWGLLECDTLLMGVWFTTF
jgi:hypothetical protein